MFYVNEIFIFTEVAAAFPQGLPFFPAMFQQWLRVDKLNTVKRGFFLFASSAATAGLSQTAE